MCTNVWSCRISVFNFTSLYVQFINSTFPFFAQYQLNSLKSICEHYLSANLNTDNVISTILLADKNEASDLKLTCTDFIIDHLAELRYAKEWRQLVSIRGDILEEILLEFASKHVGCIPLEFPLSPKRPRISSSASKETNFEGNQADCQQINLCQKIVTDDEDINQDSDCSIAV